MKQIRLYGKNLKTPRPGRRRYWTDIEAWRQERLRETGMLPVKVNVTSRSKDDWSRALSPILSGPVDTYREGRRLLRAVSAEVAWQYSKVFSHKRQGSRLVPLDFLNRDGRPNAKWFKWRNRAWANPKFSSSHPNFAANKRFVRRAFPKGSTVAGWYWNGRMLDAVTARREIYAALYCRAVRKTAAFRRLKRLYAKGDVVIFDLDGYDYVALGMTPEDTIRDLNHSWGHGLLLTLMLQGIDPRKLGLSFAHTVPIGLAAPENASAAA